MGVVNTNEGGKVSAKEVSGKEHKEVYLETSRFC